MCAPSSLLWPDSRQACARSDWTRHGVVLRGILADAWRTVAKLGALPLVRPPPRTISQVSFGSATEFTIAASVPSYRRLLSRFDFTVLDVDLVLVTRSLDAGCGQGVLHGYGELASNRFGIFERRRPDPHLEVRCALTKSRAQDQQRRLGQHPRLYGGDLIEELHDLFRVGRAIEPGLQR